MPAVEADPFSGVDLMPARLFDALPMLVQRDLEKNELFLAMPLALNKALHFLFGSCCMARMTLDMPAKR